LFIRSAEEPGLADVVQCIRDAEMEIAIVAAVSAFVDEGLYLAAEEESIRQKMLSRMKGQIEFAASVNANIPIGVLRGSQGGEEHLSILAKSLMELYEFAIPMGVEMFLEPVNRYETKMINSISDALDFISRFGLPPIKLLPDVFHMNIEDADICHALVLAGDSIGHIHFADSNRSVPGKGHLGWAEICETLSAIGYQGNFALETIPGDDPIQDAVDGYGFTKELLTRYSLIVDA
jgi:sugar phosphate isomerase/epimerase